MSIKSAPVAWWKSLRAIEECLNAKGPDTLYRLGLRGPVARVTLAEANKQRHWRLGREPPELWTGRAFGPGQERLAPSPDWRMGARPGTCRAIQEMKKRLPNERTLRKLRDEILRTGNIL
jgi:hypothetical protein